MGGEVSTAAADTANMNTERGIKAVSAASENSLFASFVLNQTNGPDFKELLDHVVEEKKIEMANAMLGTGAGHNMQR